MKKLKQLLKKHRFKISILLIGLIVVVGLIQPMKLTEYNIEGDFNLDILQVSDLHDYDYDESKVEKILESDPDIILLTGDMVDRNRYDVENMAAFVTLLKDYPVYYVTGNHESASGHLEEVIHTLESLGVIVLSNEVVSYKGIQIVGLHDTTIGESLPPLEESPKILMVHRPKRAVYYANYDFDLIFAGHAHGGQWRLFGHGILSPDQGLLPKYTSGVHDVNDSKVIINRGLGNSIFPIRWFNPPEMVMVHVRQK